MKHSAPLFKILSGCVLVGVLLLFGLQLWQYFSNPLTTTLVYKAETEVTISADGWVVREEEGFHTDGGTLIHALREGEKVGVGQLLASAYSSSGALVGTLSLNACAMGRLRPVLTVKAPPFSRK